MGNEKRLTGVSHVEALTSLNHEEFMFHLQIKQADPNYFVKMPRFSSYFSSVRPALCAASSAARSAFLAGFLIAVVLTFDTFFA